MPSGAELFVASAKSLGIDTLFTLVGDHLNEVLVAAAHGGLRIIDFRHESGAAHAADAWARLTRKPALVMVTGGPGHTNALTGLATAYLAQSPLILVSGAPAPGLAHRSGFQEIDQVAMARPVTKWAGQPAAAAQIPLFLARAWAEAMAGRMGPVHLSIPVDLFAAEVANPLPAPRPVEAARPRPDPRDVERALALLRAAQRPVVIAGSGVWWADAREELAAFLKKTRLPYYSITMARGVIGDTWRYGLGYADPALNKAVRRAFQEADVVLVLGKRIDYRLALGGPRLFAPEAKFIQVDIHPQELGRNRGLEVAICADVRETLGALADALGRESWKPGAWMRRVRRCDAEWRAELDSFAADTSAPLHPAAVYRALRDGALPIDARISWDGGDFAHWGRAIVPALVDGGWLRLGPLATIGAALPNAIALQLANPRHPVALITGDGALGFYLAELDTLVRHNLPVVIIAGNDAGWGIERELQRALTGGETVACELSPARYDLVMQAFGGGGETVERYEDIAPAVKRAFASDRPYLVNIRTRGARSPFTEWQIGGKKGR
jgi:acetolactate synthase-1/2/3 large subunit